MKTSEAEGRQLLDNIMTWLTAVEQHEPGTADGPVRMVRSWAPQELAELAAAEGSDDQALEHWRQAMDLAPELVQVGLGYSQALEAVYEVFVPMNEAVVAELLVNSRFEPAF